LHDTRRILVACVGNLLRRDDGFGWAVAERLSDLPDGVELLETGIGGIPLLQELRRGCDGLLIVDAVDRGAEPGTLFLIEPEVGPPPDVPDMHLANPDRVLALAGGMGCLPPRVLLLGCQPADADGLGQELSEPVRRAVGPATERVREVVEAWARGRAPL
jgi:hydrogenase maturation protease